MNDILNDDDRDRIVMSVLRQAGADGITEAELVRQADLVAEHVRHWKVCAGMYELYSKGGAEVELTPDESDTKIVVVDR